MNNVNNFILIKSEPEALSIYKENSLKIYNPFLNKDKHHLNEIKNNKSKGINKNKSFKIKISKKLNKSNSAVNLQSSKTHNSFYYNKLNQKEEINGDLINNDIKDINENSLNNSKKVDFNMTDKYNKSYNPKDFYLTSSKYIKIKNNNIQNSICSTKDTNNMIDLIHKKEIELCLDLIKKLPEKGINKNNENNKEKNEEEYNNLMELIRQFKFDNINNQKLIEYQIINDNNIINSSINSNILKSDIIQKNDLSNSTAMNSNQNKFIYNSYIEPNYLSSDKNLNNSSFEMINNNNSIIQNMSNILNEKSKLVKSSSANDINQIKDKKNDLNPRASKQDNFQSEINFHTGFVRSQKNIYNDAFKVPVKKIFANQKKFQRQKKESEKLTLPEIEEYKSIIKEIRKRKIKQDKRIREKIETKEDKSDFFLKDKLIEELRDIYQNQKNTFLHDINENFGYGDDKVKIDPIKKEINSNIRNINSNKRKQNYFVDGYSKFSGKINKRLNDFNYILGNKFYDKDQKKVKEEKFCRCVEEYENKINRFRNDFLKEYKIYKKIFIPKFDFSNDKNY